MENLHGISLEGVQEASLFQIQSENFWTEDTNKNIYGSALLILFSREVHRCRMGA